MGLNIVAKNRCIDIVFCMDGTGSMCYCIDNVKKHTKTFYTQFKDKMEKLNSTISSVRVKVIVFRDYKSDSDAMEISRFFELPEEVSEYERFLDGITAHGGCGEDANGLEAVYFAMNSYFVDGKNDRQVIVLFADTAPIPILKRKNCPGYPKDMVDSDGLKRIWECLDQRSKIKDRCKRLVLFAPRNTEYERMVESYKRCQYVSVEPSNGMEEISFDVILDIIAASASSR